ncbi:ThiF family adenylyltransferase [Intrasporangium sp.]|uniref:ThiF family adenylyltransferase n=1 Tax=Intrasporangium sp. TaxID=1925024 RepID=UPI003221CE3B
MKPIYPVYRLDSETFRIGAQLGITAEFNDPEGQMWTLVQNLDGRDLSEVVDAVRARHPELTAKDVIDGVALLARHGFLSATAEQDPGLPVLDRRYDASVTYFSHFAGVDEDPSRPLRALRDSSVLLLGLGGGGSNILSLLAGCGVGRVVAVDQDTVEPANLGRQILYRESDVGRPKAVAAAERIAELNSTCQVEGHVLSVRRPADVAQFLDGIDLVVCAIDEPPFVAQRVVNAACVAGAVPCVYGASQVTRGRVFGVVPHVSGCFDCINIHYTKKDPQFVAQFVGFQHSGFNPPSIAFPPPILLLCSVIVDEAVRILTGYLPPRCVGTQFEVDYVSGAAYPLLEWPHLPDDCPTCGTGRESRWEVFAHYGVAR